MSVSPLSPDEVSRFSSLLSTEKELNDNILTAQKQAKLAVEDGENKVKEIKDYYVDLAKKEGEQWNKTLEQKKAQTYEQIRQMKQLHSQQQKRSQEEFKVQSNELNHHHNNQLDHLRKTFDHELNSRREAYKNALEHETNRSEERIESTKTENNEFLKTLNKNFDQSQKKLSEAYDSQIERIKNNQQVVIKKEKNRNEREHSKLLDQHQKQLHQNQEKLNQQISKTQLDSSRKLSNYKTQQDDDFYKMRTFESQLTETNDEFILTANIPKHEQAHFYGTVRGNQLVIGGYRMHEEKRDDQIGHEQRTSSYQSYSQSYPLQHSVDANKLSREYRDHQVIIRVPKASGYSSRELNIKTPDKVQSTKPEQPENIFISSFTNES
ncbi:hypothetical protein EBS43_01425 [bacterium]|jgi:HSP20 family molecular chaperone IbpA|nr:hypothetical protein [bacterium]